MTTQSTRPVVTEKLDAFKPASSACVVSVVDGPQQGVTRELRAGATLTVGTDPRCALSLDDTAVSREHLKLELHSRGGVTVTDLGSTNGTLYLGTLVREVVVPIDAVLQVGRTRLRLSASARTDDVAGGDRTAYGSIVGSSLAMQRLYGELRKLEAHEHTVLITGETGVGKERVAQEIHAHSPRAAAPMVVFDCGAVSSQLIESELFGHVRGAFTGADRDRAGAFVRANGGTLFLDEIGELPLELQPKLLRVLEERKVRALGDTLEQTVDVRVISATNRSLEAEVEAGRFRRDLFFRINVLNVHVPALRERAEDVPLLVSHFLSQLRAPDFALSAASLEWLTGAYTWPGNVRELRNAVVRAVSLGDPSELERRRSDGVSVIGISRDSEAFMAARRRVVEAFERDYLAYHLEKNGKKLSQAARAAGMDRAYFRRLCLRYELIR